MFFPQILDEWFSGNNKCSRSREEKCVALRCCHQVLSVMTIDHINDGGDSFNDGGDNEGDNIENDEDIVTDNTR